MKKRTIIWIWVVTVALAMLTIGQSTMKQSSNRRLLDGTLLCLDAEWPERETTQEDGTRLVSYLYQVPDGVMIPNAFLYMNTYGSVFRVRRGEEILYSHMGEADGYAHVASLGTISSGDLLVIEFWMGGTDSYITLQGSTFYLGDQAGVTNMIVGESAYVFIFCFVASFLVVAIIVLALMFRKIMPLGQFEAMISLSAFIFLVGVWVLTDSRLLLLVTSRTTTVALISFLSFFAMPIFMLRFIRPMMGLADRAYRVLTIIYVLILDFFALNYVFGFVNAMIPAFIEHTMMVPTIAVAWRDGLRRLKQKESHNLRLVLYGYACYSVGVIVMLALYYLEPFSNYTRAYMLGVTGFIGFLFDAACRGVYEQIQRSVTLEAQAKLAYVDVMTNIGNRAAFHEQQMSDQETSGTLAYLMADINNLKITNDTLGHSAGDKIIIRTAHCLQQAIQGKGECFRIGGDEFVACLPDLTREQAQACLRRFYMLVEQENARSELQLSVAAGCAWTEDRAQDLDVLLEQADAEMYREKQKTKFGA